MSEVERQALIARCGELMVRWAFATFGIIRGKTFLMTTGIYNVEC